ncbi:MAG: hypothetical protein AAGA75_14145 [Cyanobacteria bacterium P01_E01_bin.6]
MLDISLMLDIHTSSDVVFNTVSTASGIRQSWSPFVTDDHALDDTIVVRFGDQWTLALRKPNETPDHWPKRNQN